jgi:Zinc knuckle
MVCPQQSSPGPQMTYIDGNTCLLLMPHRPSCYYCGEGGHTAAECNREKPIAVRNERQPGYSERSVATSYYGYGDDYGGAQGYAAAQLTVC